MGATKRMAAGSASAGVMKLPENRDSSSWCVQNERLIGEADNLIGKRLANLKNRGTFTEANLVDEIFNNILMSNFSGNAKVTEDTEDNGSVLLLGEAGSGKTHAVEYCLQKLREARGDSVVVLRACGGAYATDVECIRHLATQVQGGVMLELEPPPKNASFEQGMEWIRTVLREGFSHASSVVVVLEKFEHFCSKARQTLLYNLFDIAQEANVRLSIVGTSENLYVMDLLEKRIKSRFSMRTLHAFRPTTMKGLFEVLQQKLCLPADCGLPAPFQKQFLRHVEMALQAKAAAWEPHLDAGMPPMWFLGKCLPVSGFLREVEKSKTRAVATTFESPPKRARLQSRFTAHETDRVLIDGLCDDEHIVLVALLRLQDRAVQQTLAMVLHEIMLLHERGGMVARFSRDRYGEAFNRLIRRRLIEIAPAASGDPPRQYKACQSCVGHLYARFIAELGKGEAKTVGDWRSRNPLAALPEVVQQWAVRLLK